MLRKAAARWALGVASAIIVGAASAHAAPISVINNSLAVSATDPNGASVKYHGTIVPSDTVSFSVTGVAFLEGNPAAYGTNAAGVITNAGQFPGETVGSVHLLPGTKIVLGSILFRVNGFGPAIFKPTVANGLGSSNPTQSIVFSGPLSSLFGNFTPITNPTITFVIVDRSAPVYSDNSGGFTITAGSTTNAGSAITAIPASAPLPTAAWQSLAGLGGVMFVIGHRKFSARLSGKRG
jgi:hypothetical protein